MTSVLILASSSVIRRHLLERARVPIDVQSPRVDEEMVRAALSAEGAAPRDQADALAEIKARRISEKAPDQLVLGCDQVLDHDGMVISKPKDIETAADQLRRLRGQRHMLHSAAVICRDGEPIWRHVGTARLTMRDFSDAYLDGYLTRNWESIRHSVGGYKLEEEGVRLFARIDGDYFTILGLPLLELLGYLTVRGDLLS
ncbi:MAG: Maf family nucleotide pyrophosphatase [Pseudomonadota bacterium]